MLLSRVRMEMKQSENKGQIIQDSGGAAEKMHVESKRSER